MSLIFYMNPKKPMIGLYVEKGAGLPDLVDTKDWVFDGTAGLGEVPSATVNAAMPSRIWMSVRGVCPS